MSKLKIRPVGDHHSQPLALLTLFQNPGIRTDATDIAFSRFLSEVDQGRVRDVLIQGPEIHGTCTDGRKFMSFAPNETSWMQRLYGKGVSITVRPQQNDVPWFVSLLVSWLPFIALMASGFSCRGKCKGHARPISPLSAASQ
jgi:cell division protease FtsH